MSVERSGQAIGVETLKGQLVTGGARGFDEGRQLFIDDTSRMNREVQVRICEGLGVKFPGPTRQRSVHHREGRQPKAAFWGCWRLSMLKDQIWRRGRDSAYVHSTTAHKLLVANIRQNRS